MIEKYTKNNSYLADTALKQQLSFAESMPTWLILETSLEFSVFANLAPPARKHCQRGSKGKTVPQFGSKRLMISWVV